MKWDTIKNKCISKYITTIKNHYVFQGEKSLVSLKLMLETLQVTKYKEVENLLIDEGIKIISNWDIRNYSKLREIFENEFPKGNLVIKYNNNWSIEKVN